MSVRSRVSDLLLLLLQIYLRLRRGKVRMLDQWWILLSNCLPDRAIVGLYRLWPHLFTVTVLHDGVEVTARFRALYRDYDTSITPEGVVQRKPGTGPRWELAPESVLGSPIRWCLAWHRLTLDYPLLTRGLPPSEQGRHYHLILRRLGEDHSRLFRYREGVVTQYSTLTHTWKEVPYGAIDLRPELPPEPVSEFSDADLASMIASVSN